MDVSLSELITAFGDGVSSVAIRQEPKITNLHESRRQDMQREASEKLHSWQPLGLPLLFGRPTLVAERDLIAFEGNQARIADCHSVGVSGQVTEHLLGSAERRFGVDPPTFAS